MLKVKTDILYILLPYLPILTYLKKKIYNDQKLSKYSFFH